MISFSFLAFLSEDDSCKAEQLYDKYRGLMIYTARKMLDENTADDAVSESFIKIMRNLDKIYDTDSYLTKGYIVKIVQNTSIDILRKSGKHKMENFDDILEITPDAAVDILGSLIFRESCDKIKEIIKSLPDQLKHVVYFYFVYEYSHIEIARQLGITEAASKMRLRRAKEEIRKRLAGEEHGK